MTGTTRTTPLTVLFLAVVALALSVAAATGPSASATVWDPHVALTGRIGCNYSTRNKVTWMWVEASNGERGWGALGTDGMTRTYRFDFWKTPTSRMTVTVKWGCSTDGQHRTTFGVNRPSVGTFTTVNICYWWPCII